MPNNRQKKKKKKRKGGVAYPTPFNTPPSPRPSRSKSGSTKSGDALSEAFKRNQKKAYRTDLSINDIRSLAWDATQGSPMAIDILRDQNKKLARIANNRLRALEKAELDMFSYDRAITYLQNQGKRRFSQALPSTDDYKAMVNQLSELVTFINSKTSTVAGARDSLNKKIEKISEYTGHIYTNDQKYKLGRLLGTDSVSALLREVRGTSDEVIEVIEEISATDVQIDEITGVIDRYLQGYQPWADNSDYLNYDQLMNELREIKNNDR